MKTIILACRMLENELKKVLNEQKSNHDIVWVDKALHNSPEKLHMELQRVLDTFCNVDRVIMTFGYCGGSIAGLMFSGEIIVPCVDDCITLLLGSHSVKKQFSNKNNGTYFLTEAWLDGKQDILKEFDYTINKYGDEVGISIYKMMLANYKQFGALETGVGCPKAVLDKVAALAQCLELECNVIPATLNYLRRLISGPWNDNRFLVVSGNIPKTDQPFLLYEGG